MNRVKEYDCRKIAEGCARGRALLSEDALCFYLVDPVTGVIIEEGHDAEGRSVSGKVVVCPSGKGSSVVQADGLYQLQKKGHAPAAMIIKHLDTVIVASAIVIGIPLVSGLSDEFYQNLRPDDWLEVDATNHKVRLEDNGPS